MIERKRVLMVETAQCWYDAAKNPTPECSVEIGLFNAFNHTENALIEVLDHPDGDYAKKMRQRLCDLRSKKD